MRGKWAARALRLIGASLAWSHGTRTRNLNYFHHQIGGYEMQHNVGSTERYARLAAGVAAAAAAARTTGWQRAALGAVAIAGIGTAATRYCPINQAVGRNSPEADVSPLEQGLHDTEIRRHSEMHGALGTAPTTDTVQPRVTPEGDVFGRAEH
jgi:DUF2892 family protein